MVNVIKTVCGLFISIGMLYALTRHDVVNALVAFICVGAVPGTNITLPFWAMMLLAGVLALIIIGVMMRQSLLIGEIKQSMQADTTEAPISRKKSLSLRKLLARKRLQPAPTSSH